MTVIATEAPGASNLTSRVESIDGVPTLHVNEKPVAPLMFWGGAKPGSVEATEQWATRTFSFLCPKTDEGGAACHLRFGDRAGRLWIDRVTVVADGGAVVLDDDFSSGRSGFERTWRLFVKSQVGTDAQATVEALGDGSVLHVNVVKPTDARWHAHLYRPGLSFRQGTRYTVTIRLRAQPARRIDVVFYHQGPPWTHLGGPPSPFHSQIRHAARAGVNIISYQPPVPWEIQGKRPDFRRVDEGVQRILEANPEGLLLPRLSVWPPHEWYEAHPDERMEFEPGYAGLRPPSISSKVWQEDAATAIRRMIRHFEQQFGDRTIGYHICGQNTGEWFYQGTWMPQLSGYSEPTRRAFREWLRGKYGNDKALRAAWADRQTSLATAEPPSPQKRRADKEAIFLTARPDRQVKDFVDFQQDEMARCVERFASLIRAETGGNKLSVFFFGYLFELAAPSNGPTVSGHLTFRRILDCPDIDVLCAPLSYGDRAAVGSTPFMTAVDSVAVAGKLWLNEDDTRTHRAVVSPGQEPYMAAATMDQTQHVLRRDFAQILPRNMACWYMDLMGDGWFDEPGIWNEIANLRKLYDARVSSPRPYEPEIAVVVDDASLRHMSLTNVVTLPLLSRLRQQLLRIGAPVGWYLLDDALAGRLEHAKLLIILNAFSLSAERRATLKRIGRRKSLVWFYMPGYLAPDDPDPAASSDLTGFRLRCAGGSLRVRVDATLAPSVPVEFGPQAKVRARFVVVPDEDEEVSIWARYTGHDAPGQPAIAARRIAEQIHVFVGTVTAPSSLLREIARQAGVHVYTSADAVVLGGGDLLAVAAVADGPLRIMLPRQATVEDALTSRRVAGGSALTLQAKAGQTFLMRVRRR